MHCPTCQGEMTLDDSGMFRCPKCGTRATINRPEWWMLLPAISWFTFGTLVGYVSAVIVMALRVAK